MEPNPKIESFLREIETAELNSEGSLESFRIRFLGSRGLLKSLFAGLKDIPAGERKEYGQQINALKEAAEGKYAAAKASLELPGTQQESPDPTLPGTAPPVGSRHPISIIRNQLIRIFDRLGFTVAEGPEIEDDWHNFTALNMPKDHPARDMQDTFYISRNPDWVLRTHTSSVQVRVMEQGKLPIRIICPGRVYRNETVSARA
ncbi:MAG TPA: hypothetical protein VMV20_05930, partial [Chitinophagaceae bacterium]|nr:hypothetical protein [Chitinophagaceae bacterium]